MGISVLFLSGCEKAPEKPAIDPRSPESYMNDKAFMGKLDAVKAEQVDVMKKFHKAALAYKKAKEADPKVEKPETQALQQTVDDLEKQYKALRQKMQATVRERISPRGARPADQK